MEKESKEQKAKNKADKMAKKAEAKKNKAEKKALKNKDKKPNKFIEIIKKKWLINGTKTAILVVALVAIFMALNLGMQKLNLTPLDFTQEKLYTLTDESKEKINENYIRYSYYELKVKNNLSEEEIDEVLKISRNYFENKAYNVYFTNAEFEYRNAKRIVETNEYMIAFKE